MNVAVLKNPYTFAYVVSGVPEEYRHHLLDQLYWPVENSYIRQWAGNPNAEIIANNFKKYGVQSLEQLFKIQPAPWEQALSAFIKKLDGTGIQWYIHGSTAMALWGINVAPRDLNIIFPNLADFERVRQLLLDITLYPLELCSDWVMGGLGGLFIHANIGLAFMNAGNVPFDMGRPKELDWKGSKIAISQLEWLKNDNQNYGRPQRVELIEKFLNKR